MLLIAWWCFLYFIFATPLRSFYFAFAADFLYFHYFQIISLIFHYLLMPSFLYFHFLHFHWLLRFLFIIFIAAFIDFFEPFHYYVYFRLLRILFTLMMPFALMHIYFFAAAAVFIFSFLSIAGWCLPIPESEIWICMPAARCWERARQRQAFYAGCRLPMSRALCAVGRCCLLPLMRLRRMPRAA